MQMATSSNIRQITVIVNVPEGYELLQLWRAPTPPSNPTALSTVTLHKLADANP